MRVRLNQRFPLELLAAPTEENGKQGRTFKGLAAAYGNKFYRYDRSIGATVATVLQAGTFAESVAAINSAEGIRKGNIPLMFEHLEVIGRTLSLEDTPQGVVFTARVADAREFDRYLALMADGSVNGMSIGFDIDESAMAKTTEETIEYVTKGTLAEITACTWGANSVPYLEAASRLAEAYGHMATGKVLRKELKTRADCAASDLAHILQAANKAAEADEDGDGSSAALWILSERLSIVEAKLASWRPNPHD